MNVYAISDLHMSGASNKPMNIFGDGWEGHIQKIKDSWNSLVKDDDVVLIAGDISWAMKLEEVTADLDWIDRLPGKKIIIKGNHEYWWKSISAVREILPESIMAIQNDAIKIGNYIICGTRGWTVPEKDKELEPDDLKIYKREVERLKLTLRSAKVLKADTDAKIIAMMHFPPYNTDREPSEFTKLFEEYEVDKVIFGHLHGYVNCSLVSNMGGVTYYFTSCDHIKNDPVLIEK